MSLTLLNWRRETAAMYSAVRNATDLAIAHADWCIRRDELFAHHPDSPLTKDERAAFKGLRYGNYDERFRFECEVVRTASQRSFEAATGTDGVVRYTQIGSVRLGDLGTVDVWWHEGYGGGIFLPIADRYANNYGGGRYVIDTIKGADLGGAVDLSSGNGTLVVDLNFSYNPSCAYDPAWACPLAPPGNRITAEIPVGERSFGSH